MHLPPSEIESNDLGGAADDGERRKAAGTPDITTPESHDGCGVGGSLASALCRNGLRVGGLVLVNGFMSKDGQCQQVKRKILCERSFDARKTRVV